MTTAASSGETTWRIEVRIRNCCRSSGQVADDLLGEVVVELLVGAAQAPDEPADLGRRPIAERGLDELERRGPAFGPGGDVGEDVGFELAPVRLGEEPRRLGSVEPEVVGPDLGDLARGAQPGERDRSASAGWRRRSTAAPGARATSSRAMIRTSGDSSTRWKSSRMRTAPCSAIVGSSRRKTSVAASRVGPPVARSLSIAAVVGRELGIVLPARGDEVAQERDPVPIVVVEPIPQGPQPGPPREIGEERRLAVARRRRGPGSRGGGSWRPANRGADRAPASRRAAADAGPSRVGSGSRSFRRQRLHVANGLPAGRPGPTATGLHRSC